MNKPLAALPPECLQQEYETAAAYQAFLIYLHQERPRSVVEAYWQYRQTKGKKTANLKRPSQANSSWNSWAAGKTSGGADIDGALSWKQRAEAYDKQADEQLEQVRATKRLKELERELSAQDKLLTLFNEQLENAPAFMKSRRIEEKDGNVITILETIGLNIKGLKELAGLHADLMQQRRLTLGMAQKLSELHHGNVDKSPLKIEHTVDELIKRALQELEDEGNDE